MDDHNEILDMLELMLRPGFCVENGKLVKVNQAAESLCLRPGLALAPLLLTGKEEYATFRGGALYLTMEVAGTTMGASVSRVGELDVFLLEDPRDDQELKAMALAAQQLRSPLSGILSTAQQLFPMAIRQGDAEALSQVSRMNRGLYQILRVLCNMSDAAGLGAPGAQEVRELQDFFREVFGKAAAFLEQAGIRMTYKGPRAPVHGAICADQMERAVLNLLSNAMKFTPTGGLVRVEVTRKGDYLRITVADSGSGLSEQAQSNPFTRYLRQPGLEDSRFGLGLGMVLVRAAAADHGGVVLVDEPAGAGTRVTMTIDLRREPDPKLHSQVLAVDYTGQLDHWLVELADCLPAEAFSGEFPMA